MVKIAWSQNQPCFLTPYSHAGKNLGVIDFIRAGNPKGETLLLVPGIPGQIYDFHKVIPLLVRSGFDVLSVSAPGKGHSIIFPEFFNGDDHNELNLYGHFWNWVFKIFEIKKVTVVAFSSGLAEIAQAIALSQKSNLPLNRIISVGGWAPHLVPERISEGLDKNFIDPLLGPLAYKLIRPTPIFKNQIQRAFYQYNKTPRELNQWMEEYLEGFPKAPHPEDPPKIKKKLMEKIAGFCHSIRWQYFINRHIKFYFNKLHLAREKLKGIPHLIIVGDHDKIVREPRAKNGIPYATKLYRSILHLNEVQKPYLNRRFQFHIIKDAGHMIPHENPEQLAQEIENFIHS